MNQRKAIIFLTCIFFPFWSFTQIEKYNYKHKLEPNSKVWLRGYNYTIEKLKNGKYIKKTYYPENKNITQHITFASKKFNVLDGLYYEGYDDGTIYIKGNIVDNKKQGVWIEHGQKGNYIDNKKEGKWLRYHQDQVLKEYNFVNGELDGKQLTFDSLGQVIYESIYEEGELVSTTQDTTNTGYKRVPRFSGCEHIEGNDKMKKECAEKKLIEYIGQNIKYPNRARKQEIEGTAIVKFMVEKDGNLSNIEVLRGLSIDIKEECQRLIENMPRWIPGYQRGIPVRVEFKLPIKFYMK